ncbi:MAG: ABC transporter substrate-binding protein [candidate division Zixibacteria bacterium]|nr:ABC transporter substrate-binding protein [candidate division Zixibacteria bacterium]
MLTSFTRRWLCGMIVLGALCVSSTTFAQKVAIITTDTLTSTQRSVSGAKSIIKNAFPQVVFSEHLISLANGSPTTDLDSLRALKPSLILATGTAATEFARKNFRDVPIVFSSVMYPIVSGFVESFNRPGGNITGASLSIPPKTQFDYFKMIVPKLRTIGVLYTSNTEALIPQAKQVAKGLGLDLVSIKVSGEKELPAAFDSLSRVVQGIWSLADPNLFSPQATKFILLNALRRGIPLMGFSRNVVESGALFALDFDYKAVGRQAGEIASQILKGAEPGNVSVTTPDIIWFHYNEKTAQHINIAMPSDLVAVAKEVYR